MTAEEALEAIKQGRSEQLDWFSEQSPVSAIATVMLAMANTLGGRILLGVVGPSGSALGVRDTRLASDRLLQAALSLTPPLIVPLPQTLVIRGQPVVAVEIPQGMPHVYALDGRYLQRKGADNVPLTPEELRLLIVTRTETSFETEPAHGATLDDIHWDKVREYVASLSGINETDPHKILLKRGCLIETPTGLCPTNAGILLFGREPQRFLRGADITAARFPGETMSDSFQRQDISGSLPDQIRRAETFLVDHLRKQVTLQHTMARKESFEYPLEAARELVVNAVAHRDYSIAGDGIRLFIFTDRMEITSPGRLPGPVTIQNIKDERFSRNPALVQVLSDMGFIERLGYGVDRVLDLMREQNLEAPQFSETAGGFRVTLRSARQADHATGPEDEAGEIDFNGSFNGIEINIRQEAALKYLHQPGNSRITNSDLQQLCPDVHAETLRLDLVDLVAKNILKKMGQKRGSYYVIKRN